MKKALVFDPYLDTLGGGERYALTFALGLIKVGYSVDVAWSNSEDLHKATERFGLDLSQVKLNPKAFQTCWGHSSILHKFIFTKQYDLIFWVSDGSLPFLFGKNNLIHFQVPFTRIGGNSWLNQIKILLINKFVYNSKFTQKVHEKHFPSSKSFVLYPPVDTDTLKGGRKENLILSVARFDSPSHSKRQDILLEAFADLAKKVKNYKLVLVGGLLGDGKTLSSLRIQAENLPVDFVINPRFTELKKFYSKARFFWHAAGFGIDEDKFPEEVEHFGMTTVEAVASGCVPIVIAKGGQKEVVTSDTGVLCLSPSEISRATARLITDTAAYQRLFKKVSFRAKLFSINNFYKKITQLLHE